jgi:hypothetical protein
LEQNKNIVPGVFPFSRRIAVIRVVVAEAATLASLALCLGLVAVWVQIIATL